MTFATTHIKALHTPTPSFQYLVSGVITIGGTFADAEFRQRQLFHDLAQGQELTKVPDLAGWQALYAASRPPIEPEDE